MIWNRRSRLRRTDRRPVSIGFLLAVSYAMSLGSMAFGEVRSFMEAGAVLERLPNLAEVANAALFAASDLSSAMAGTILNLTCGSVMDKN